MELVPRRANRYQPLEIPAFLRPRIIVPASESVIITVSSTGQATNP